jgi:hypothetical protein
MKFMVSSPRFALFVLTLCGLVSGILFLGRGNSQEAAPKLVPMEDVADAPELALLMADLQRLTHKLALSADAANVELAAFYLHESLEQLQTIQRKAPEYEKLPVALLIDRLALPAYERMKTATTNRPADREQLLGALDAIVQACNQCHVATQHGFLRITRGTEVNPFNQSFKP